MKNRSGEKIKLASIDELLGVVNEESAMEILILTGDHKEFNKEFFENENWYIRLLMEAEDRMEYSQSKVKSNHGVFSNSDVTDDALMDFIFYST